MNKQRYYSFVIVAITMYFLTVFVYYKGRIPMNIFRRTKTYLFKGNGGYAFTYWSPAFGMPGMSVSFEYKSTTKSGTIMAIGNPGPARAGPPACAGTTVQPCNPYCVISLASDGKVQFTYASMENTVVLKSTVNIVDGTNHKVAIKREGDVWTMTIDGADSQTVTKPMTSVIPPDKMLFGMIPFIMTDVTGPLTGCLQNINVNGVIMDQLRLSGDVGITCASPTT